MGALPTTPQPFSYKNATDALDELFNAIPKSKRVEFLAALNEVGMYMQLVHVFFRTGYPEDEQREVENVSVRDVLLHQLEVSDG